MRTIFEIRAEAQHLASLHLTDADIGWLADHGHEAARHIVDEQRRNEAYRKAHEEALKDQARFDALGIDYDVVMAAGTGWMIGVIPCGRVARSRRYINERYAR